MILNSLLQPLESPVTTTRGTMGYLWDTTADRGMIHSMQIQNASIGTAKIQAFNFNQGTGGTLTLGGTTNGNGVLQINNSSGSALITADNSGLTIKANNGTTIIDNIGIISQSNFKSDTKIDTNTHKTTSTSYVDVTGGTLVPLVITRPTKVLMYLDVNGYNDNNPNDISHFCVFNLTDGTTDHISQAIIGQYLIQGGTAIGFTSQEQVQIVITNFNAGTYNLKVQQMAYNGGTCTLNYLRIGYVVLGS
jgi:hypothetical protein